MLLSKHQFRERVEEGMTEGSEDFLALMKLEENYNSYL